MIQRISVIAGFLALSMAASAMLLVEGFAPAAGGSIRSNKFNDPTALHSKFTANLAFSRGYSSRPSGITLKATPESSSSGRGTYHNFAEYAWTQLSISDLFEQLELDDEYAYQKAPAKGFPNGTIVQITTKAMVPKEGQENVVQYARYALLETLLPKDEDDDDSSIQTQGIQVLNFVVMPSNTTNLPVLGVDLVSLPGDKHLLLLDAQPMTTDADIKKRYEDYFNDWYQRHSNPDLLPWGGDFPEPVLPYVSSKAVWTRLSGADAPATIQETVYPAFCELVDAYLNLLLSSSEAQPQPPQDNHQTAYINYRRDNDPAKPMLNALYGKEWTEALLNQVLFPTKGDLS